MYCTDRCRVRAQRRRKAERKRAAHVVDDRACAWCGVSFTTSLPQKIFCRRECTSAARYARNVASGREREKEERRKARYVPREPRYAGECETCGDPFRAHIDTKRFCSTPCRRLAAWRRNPKTRPVLFDVEAWNASGGEPVHARVRVSASGGLIVLCPFHDGDVFMGCVPGVHADDERWCYSCRGLVVVDLSKLERAVVLSAA